MSFKEYWKQSWYWPLVGVAIGLASAITTSICSNKIPNTSDVKAGYVIPSKLEIDVKDADLDGKPEATTLTYEDENKQKTTYLLKLIKESIYDSETVTTTIKTKPSIISFEVKELR